MNRKDGSKYPYDYRSGQHLARFIALIGKLQRNKNQPTPAQNNKNAKGDTLARYTWRLTIATWIIAFAAVLNFGASLLQWSAMRRQVDIMQRQLDDAEIQEAASITIRNLTVTGFPDKPIVSFEVANSGRTRADRISMVPGYTWMPPEGVLGFLSRDDAFGGPTRASEFGFSIEPSEPPRRISFPLAAVPPPRPPSFPSEQYPTRNDIISGQFTTLVYVIGTYNDVFGRVHHVSDCIGYIGVAFYTCFGSNRHY